MNTWRHELDTGIDEVDLQHRMLFKRIDNLVLAIYQGNALNELKSLLDYLDYCVNEHFKAEEELMVKSEYPDYLRHEEKHIQFKSLFQDIVNQFREKGPDNYLAIRVEKEVRSWWENHITQVDMKYVPYVKQSRNK